jgi:hypothetical protein
MIVLESTYKGTWADGRPWDGDTANCIQMFHDRIWFDETFTTLFDYVICKPLGESRESALERLVVTNLVEEVLESARTRPNQGQIDIGREGLEDRLKVLRPRVVLLLGDIARQHGGWHCKPAAAPGCRNP